MSKSLAVTGRSRAETYQDIICKFVKRKSLLHCFEGPQLISQRRTDQQSHHSFIELGLSGWEIIIKPCGLTPASSAIFPRVDAKIVYGYRGMGHIHRMNKGSHLRLFSVNQLLNSRVPAN